MKVLIAPDSFGGTLTAVEAAHAIAAGWAAGAPDDETVCRPLSDGGPGFVDVLSSTLEGRLLAVEAPDPLGRPVSTDVLLDGETAYVEAAQACGLHLLTKDELDPKATTSYGVGVMIAAAVEAGARRIVIGLGGSATNDCGAGMLAALGVTTLDVGGLAAPYGGAPLAGADRLTGAPRLRGAELVAASDVDNPLVGEHGASAVFGPQKGATPDDVALLDAALAHYGAIVERDLPGCPPGLLTLPGAGAAGGLGAALLALGARRESGITLIRTAIDLDAAMAEADLAISGEGSFDWQSLRGKVAVGVAESAASHGVPCLVLAGQVAVGRKEMAAAGVEDAYAVAEYAGSVEAAMAEPDRLLRELAARVATQWHVTGSAATT